MRTVRFLVPLVMAALGLIVLPSVANAVPYPVGSPLLTVDRSTITVGEAVHVHGSGFAPGENTNVGHIFQNALRPPAGTMVPIAYTGQTRRAADPMLTDGNGDFDLDLVLDQEGMAVITADGPISGSASVNVRVLPAGARLPVTGQSGTALRIALIGSAVAAAGVVLMVLVRSRRRRIGTHSG
jgi:hypothetical protein